METGPVIAPAIAAAVAEAAPVVALETTLIAHGLPYPRNVETWEAMESMVRDEGAVPATIGILDGRIRVGLARDEIELLARGGEQILKISRRDLGFAISAGRDGGTTVTATMIAAAMAGIPVMATGGIGGVHRGAETTMDISADLEELATTRVAVVCAGAKAILDLPRTLEYLETRGVPVAGYGTDAFPGFFIRDSGLDAPLRVDTPEEAARLMAAHWGLPGAGGLVIANPAPADSALDRYIAEDAIAEALVEAARENISGKPLTPFLLDRLAELTGGDSLEANIALLRNNARLAARIAIAYAEQESNAAAGASAG
jgi:pseudouridine-5'-phosphate glycosidase